MVYNWGCQHGTEALVAIDETVILLTLSLSPSPLIHLLKVEGGAAE